MDHVITPPIFASIVFYLFARGISAYFYPVLPCGSLEVQPRSYRHGLWTHSHKYLHFRIPFIVRFGDETFIPRLPTSRGLYTTDICGLVSRVGLEPTYPEGVEFTVPCNCRYATDPYRSGRVASSLKSFTALIYYCELAIYKGDSFNFSSLARDMPQCHNCGMAGDRGDDPLSFGSKPNVSTGPLIPNIY